MNTIIIMLAASLTWNVNAQESEEYEGRQNTMQAIEAAPGLTIEAVTGWTIKELKTRLDRLDRVYMNETKTESGRVKWHGPRVNTFDDTNACITVVTYEDGFKFTEPFTIKKPQSLADRMERQRKLNEALEKRRLSKLPPALREVEKARAKAAATTNEVTATFSPDK